MIDNTPFVAFPMLPILTFILVLVKLLGAASLPWLVVFLPLIICVAPPILFAGGIMLILAFVVVSVAAHTVNAFVNGK
jgi:hypothetical protein